MATTAPGITPTTLALGGVSPTLALEVLPYGMTIHRFVVNADGKTHDLVIGPENPQHHVDRRGFLNTVVGRYSNRIPVGEHELQKGDVTSDLSVAATESPQVSLHGGADGFDRRIFDVIDPTESSDFKLFSSAEKDAIKSSFSSAAIFKLTSPDGDQGFPGELDVEVLIGLVEPPPATTAALSGTEIGNGLELGSVLIVYRAKLAQENTVTPVNLTQHWGFNLDASTAGAGNPTPLVKDHNLTLPATSTIDLHPNMLATGTTTHAHGTHHEHKGKKIGEGYPSGGYDNFYLFSKSPQHSLQTWEKIHVSSSDFESLNAITPLTTKTGEQRQTAADLASALTGLRLVFASNQPGVQFYTGGGLNGSDSRKLIHGGNGESGNGYTAGAAAFLEFHEPLAAFHHKWEDLGTDTLLLPGQVYNNWTKATVYFKRPS